MTKTKNWDEYFLANAEMIAERSTCDRAHVGAILVKDNRIIATGYNGAPSGMPECDEVGHLMVGGHCKRTIHAELNAFLQCARFGVSALGSTLYVTHTPCEDCRKVITQMEVSSVIISRAYGGDTEDALNWFNERDIYAAVYAWQHAING